MMAWPPDSGFPDALTIGQGPIVARETELDIDTPETSDQWKRLRDRDEYIKSMLSDGLDAPEGLNVKSIIVAGGIGVDSAFYLLKGITLAQGAAKPGEYGLNQYGAGQWWRLFAQTVPIQTGGRTGLFYVKLGVHHAGAFVSVSPVRVDVRLSVDGTVKTAFAVGFQEESFATSPRADSGSLFFIENLLAGDRLIEVELKQQAAGWQEFIQGSGDSTLDPVLGIFVI